MAHVARLDAYTHPFQVVVVDEEILAISDEAPVEIVFTADSARDTAHRLLEAADRVARGKSN